MKITSAVRQTTARIAAGVGVMTLLMLGVYLIAGRFGVPVLLGALLGAAVAIGNFFLMALSVQRAAEKMNGAQLPPLEEAAEGEEPAEPPLSPQAKAGRRLMQLSYTGRLLLIGAMAALAYYAPCFDPVPALLAQLFPRVTIFIQGILTKKETQAQ